MGLFTTSRWHCFNYTYEMVELPELLQLCLMAA